MGSVNWKRMSKLTDPPDVGSAAARRRAHVQRDVANRAAADRRRRQAHARLKASGYFDAVQR